MSICIINTESYKKVNSKITPQINKSYQIFHTYSPNTNVEHLNQTELKKLYHKLELKYHPNKSKTNSEKARATEIFKKIGSAYSTLTQLKTNTH